MRRRRNMRMQAGRRPRLCDVAWQGRARLGAVGQGKAGSVWHGVAWRGEVWHGRARQANRR